MAKPKKTETNAHNPEMEKAAVLCTVRDCLGYRVLDVPKHILDANKTSWANMTCRCNSNLSYSSTFMRNPDAPENQIILLKRDVERLEKENAKIKKDAEVDRIRLETTNNVLDRIGRLNNGPFVVPGYPFGRGHGY